MSDASLPTEIKNLAGQIMSNCHRSDAKYAGSFSLCGLLLRLRDFFRWESGLAPWAPVEGDPVLDWIQAREDLWCDLENMDVEPLVWRDQRIEPYDFDKINQDLIPQGFYYGAGLAAFLKPTFFLARLIRQEKLNGLTVSYLGDELARDLFTVPAMTRGNEIVARRRPLAAYLWDTILHSGASRQRAIGLALECYGLERSDFDRPDKEWRDRFEQLLDGEVEPFVWHEYGEATDENFPVAVWRAIIGGHPHSRVELMARTIKDLLADTGDSGRLNFIIQNQREASLGIYVALMDGLSSCLFPEIDPIFEDFLTGRDWTALEQARQEANNRAVNMARQLMELSQKNKSGEWLADQVEKTLYKPLNL
jgi:hypothetical protein